MCSTTDRNRPSSDTVFLPRAISARCRFLVMLCWLPCVDSALAGNREDFFQHQVMAVLSRAGCNMGACHGNLNGKGGLALSLRGQDPNHDYLAITHELGGRRVNRTDPADSLILMKPTSRVPHQGGQRIKPESQEYQILLDWLNSGFDGPREDAIQPTGIQLEPSGLVVRSVAEPFDLRVIATMSDGSRRDVTQLATFEVSNFVARVSDQGQVVASKEGEVTVSARYLSVQASLRAAFVSGRSGPADIVLDRRANNIVDRYVLAKLAQLQLKPTRKAANHLILRRIYLDVVGQLPSEVEANRFANDAQPDKIERLIDRLLADPRFADRWALIWSDLLRNEEKLLDRRGVKVFHEWLRQAFAEGLPLDQFVSQLLTAEGSTYEHPPANFYRALRDPLTRGEAAARLFLGLRLQCAKCHNHPFDRWTQDDYYAWASMFANVDYEIVENKRKDKFDKSEFVGEQRVVLNPKQKVKNARTGENAVPGFLGERGDRLSLGDVSDQQAARQLLQNLANWVTGPDNEAFAKSQANRIWYHLMGRGLVDPIDDFRVTNPASHPRLLSALADELVSSGFDVRHVVRLILRSSTYQAAAVDDDLDPLTVANYAGVRPRRLTAEQLLDAQCSVLGVPAKFNGYAVGLPAGRLAGIERIRRRDKKPSEDDRFLDLFGKPSRQMSCECERSDGTNLSQAFYLINGKGLQKRLEDPSNRLAYWAGRKMPVEQIVDELYWRALSRKPTLNERRELTGYLDRGNDGALVQRLRDIAWALLNSKEFLFRN